MNLISVQLLDMYKRFGVMQGPLLQGMRFELMFSRSCYEV